MRIALLVAGIVVLLVGFIGALFFLFGATGAETAHAFLCGGGGPPVTPEYCDGLLATASMYRSLAIALAVVGAGGLALTIAGGAMRGPPAAAPTMMPQPVPPPMAGAVRSCPRCGTPNDWAGQFCTRCGSAL